MLIFFIDLNDLAIMIHEGGQLYRYPTSRGGGHELLVEKFRCNTGKRDLGVLVCFFTKER